MGCWYASKGKLTYYGKQVNETGLRPAHGSQPEATEPDHMQKPRLNFFPHAGNSVRQKAGKAKKRASPVLRKGQEFHKGTESREALRKSLSLWTRQRPGKKGTNASRFWKTESPAHARHMYRRPSHQMKKILACFRVRLPFIPCSSCFGSVQPTPDTRGGNSQRVRMLPGSCEVALHSLCFTPALCLRV